MPSPIHADLSGHTCLVTGANTGIGKEVARGLARMGATVVMACRDAARAEQARQEIVASTANPRVEVGIVDLASQSSIRAFAQTLTARIARLDILVNNAGIWSSRRQVSADGIERTWATNVLGYFLLTDLMRPVVEATPGARIVNVASTAAGGLDLDDVEFRRRPYGGIAAYQQSKQADRMLTWALARRLEGTGVTANAMHPGGVATEIFRKAGGLLARLASLAVHLIGRSPARGADTVVWLAASPEVTSLSGRFWIDRRERRCRFRDPANEERLVALCDHMTRSGGG